MQPWRLRMVMVLPVVVVLVPTVNRTRAATGTSRSRRSVVVDDLARFRVRGLPERYRIVISLKRVRDKTSVELTYDSTPKDSYSG